MSNTKEVTSTDVQKIFANPFYCLPAISPVFIQEHEPLVSEEEWIKVGAKTIKEIGAEKFLEHLLENLKGNYVG